MLASQLGVQEAYHELTRARSHSQVSPTPSHDVFHHLWWHCVRSQLNRKTESVGRALLIEGWTEQLS